MIFFMFMRFYAGAIANNFLLQEDNARLHTALIVEHYFQLMEWPSESLDKNLIECVWDILGRCNAALNSPPPPTSAMLTTDLQEQ